MRSHLFVSVCTRLRKPNRRTELGLLGRGPETSSDRRGRGETARTTGNDSLDSTDCLRRFGGFLGAGRVGGSGRAEICERGGKAFSDGRIYPGMNGLGFDTGGRGRSVGGPFALARGDW